MDSSLVRSGPPFPDFVTRSSPSSGPGGVVDVSSRLQLEAHRESAAYAERQVLVDDPGASTT
jgi:hypothetical protein